MDFNPRSLTGATEEVDANYMAADDFNPRSLTGATLEAKKEYLKNCISIHAPLRERPSNRLVRQGTAQFQSTLPYGSDPLPAQYYMPTPEISIHAPLRERHFTSITAREFILFQSTLPYGSDPTQPFHNSFYRYFNPRSLTGATASLSNRINIHHYFNPRSLTGATNLQKGQKHH